MHIVVYSWDEAPEELQALSQHGGDEDWVIVVPPEYLIMPQSGSLGALLLSEGRMPGTEYVRGYVTGWGWVERYEHKGDVVFITAHA